MTEWLDTNGLKAIDRMGWPEWDGEDAYLHRLFFDGRGFVDQMLQDDSGAPTTSGCYDGGMEPGVRVALALLRDHGREYAEKHGIRVQHGQDCYLVIDKDDFYWAGDGEWSSLGMAEFFPTYDSALIAAVLAVETSDG